MKSKKRNGWLSGFAAKEARGMNAEGYVHAVLLTEDPSSWRAKAMRGDGCSLLQRFLKRKKPDARSILDYIMNVEEDLNSSRGRRRRGVLGLRVLLGRGGFTKFKHMILARNHARKRNKDAPRKRKHACQNSVMW